jgi:putative phosphonate metabolism protein
MKCAPQIAFAKVFTVMPGLDGEWWYPRANLRHPVRMQATRYAIYYVPPKDSPLAAFGGGWLGYDIDSGQAAAPPELAGIDVADITEEPRRYGFHATLKAPFALADGATEADLIERAARFAAQTRAAAGPKLVLAAIAGFLALVPDGQAPEIARLADDCMRVFDSLRRPPDPAELAKRAAAGLTARQAAHLARWGYPYVLEEFRFHMTLTRRLSAAERPAIEATLAARTAEVTAAPLDITDIALCRQEPDAAFRLWRRVSLAGA